MVHSWGRSLNGHLCPLKCLIRLPYHGALKIEELNRLRDNPSERAQETKQPSEDSRIVVEDKCCVTDAHHHVCGQNSLIWDPERRLCGKVKIKKATTLLYLDFLLRFEPIRTGSLSLPILRTPNWTSGLVLTA